ncbi:MAG: SusD/RagB family nutrient-binding outer membrane lipoprotein, partial [Flavihumibacter sp.]|nr:SusD/RagB family nutrient-binding outer membrane lipoprotein [Flavihumibacter sp.]
IPNANSKPAWEPIVASGTAIPYGNVPRRLTYPASEYATNTTNIQSFLSKQGPDLETTKLWWDKN